MSRHRCGFTFAELLAAMGLLAILILLGFAVWYPNAAARSDCMANVQDIAKAALVYADDYDRVLPRVYFDGDRNGRYDPHGGLAIDGASDYAWAYALIAYSRSFQCFTCKVYPDDQGWDGRIAPRADATGISYGYNLRLGEVGYELARLAHPSRTVLLFDLAPNMAEPWAGLPDLGNASQLGSLGNVEERVRANHFGRSVSWRRAGDGDTGVAIVGFCDGHVQPRRIAQLLTAGRGAMGNVWDPAR